MVRTLSLGVKLGHGISGVVREAIDEKTGEEFACKVISKDNYKQGGREPWMVESKLERECRISREVSGQHPGVVSVVDGWEDESRSYILMELCKGGSLEDYVGSKRWMRRYTRGVPLSLPSPCVSMPEGVSGKATWTNLREMDAGCILGEVASAVAFLHQKGILHRDLKPLNILIKPQLQKNELLCGVRVGSNSKLRRGAGRLMVAKSKMVATVTDDYNNKTAPNATGMLKVCDFGLAEEIGKYGAACDGLIGTLHFMAPEVVRGDDVSFPSDIWSLGIILYFLLTGGRLPFEGRSMSTVLASISLGWVDFQRKEFRGLSIEAKMTLRKMLDLNPNRRPTATEVAGMPWVREQQRKRDILLELSH